MSSEKFLSLAKNPDIFVDKSDLIKEIFDTKSDSLLILRPWRWGKTINMEMLKQFLEIEVDNEGYELKIKQNFGVLMEDMDLKEKNL